MQPHLHPGPSCVGQAVARSSQTRPGVGFLSSARTPCLLGDEASVFQPTCFTADPPAWRDPRRVTIAPVEAPSLGGCPAQAEEAAWGVTSLFTGHLEQARLPSPQLCGSLWVLRVPGEARHSLLRCRQRRAGAGTQVCVC